MTWPSWIVFAYYHTETLWTSVFFFLHLIPLLLSQLLSCADTTLTNSEAVVMEVKVEERKIWILFFCSISFVHSTLSSFISVNNNPPSFIYQYTFTFRMKLTIILLISISNSIESIRINRDKIQLILRRRWRSDIVDDDVVDLYPLRYYFQFIESASLM